jgi:hypothetical protein
MALPPNKAAEENGRKAGGDEMTGSAYADDDVSWRVLKVPESGMKSSCGVNIL